MRKYAHICSFVQKKRGKRNEKLMRLATEQGVGGNDMEGRENRNGIKGIRGMTSLKVYPFT